MKPKQEQLLFPFAIMQPCNKAVLLGTFFRSTSHRFFKITPKIFNVQ